MWMEDLGNGIKYELAVTTCCVNKWYHFAKHTIFVGILIWKNGCVVHERSRLFAVIAAITDSNVSTALQQKKTKIFIHDVLNRKKYVVFVCRSAHSLILRK